MHEEVMYKSYKCKYRAATQRNLICYIQSVHEESKFDCNKYENRGTHKGNLAGHIQELSMSVTSVNIELLHRVILYVTYSQYMKELCMSVASVIMKLLERILLLGI